MKIYTKTGDKGETGLLGGSRVSKAHVRIDAYGTVDELNSWIGLLADESPIPEAVELLRKVQHELFNIGSHLAAENDRGRSFLTPLKENMEKELESAIDLLSADLPTLRNFVLPGGHPIVSRVHIARTVCRRAERMAVHLGTIEAVEPVLVMYLNRLSDYLFTLARASAFRLNANEIVWNSKS